MTRPSQPPTWIQALLFLANSVADSLSQPMASATKVSVRKTNTDRTAPLVRIAAIVMYAVKMAHTSR